MISVIVPVYNTEKYLRECVDSILAQTYTDFEVLLVDDGSTDRSGEICDEYVLKDSHVHVFHKENGGSAIARNVGIDNSRGEFIMFVDADDWLEHDAIESLIKKQQETDADIVSGNAIAHYLDHQRLMAEPLYANKDDMMRHMVKLTMDHVFWKRIIRRSLFLDYNIRCVEGVNIGEDHHTLPRLIYYAKMCVALDKVVYHYNCMNEGSYMNIISPDAHANRFVSDMSSVEILIDFFKDKDLSCVTILEQERYRYVKGIRPFLVECYFAGDRRNYDVIMKYVYSLGDRYLKSINIVGTWQKIIRKSYRRFRCYNAMREYAVKIGIIK